MSSSALIPDCLNTFIIAMHVIYPAMLGFHDSLLDEQASVVFLLKRVDFILIFIYQSLCKLSGSPSPV
jgi:hypothetical protein